MGEQTRRIFRYGKHVQADAAFEAWTSGTLSEKLAAARVQTNGVDRHFLLLSIVGELYQRRHESPGIAQLLIKYGRLHLAELAHLLAEMERSQRADWAARGTIGVEYRTPAVPTIDQLSMALCEAGDFDGARAVYEEAVRIGYLDSTVLPHSTALIEKRRKRLEKAAAARA